MDAVDTYAGQWKTPLIKAEVLRARGDYDGAARIWAETGSTVFEARAHIEAALARGQPPDRRSVAILRSAGDVEFLESRQVEA